MPRNHDVDVSVASAPLEDTALLAEVVRSLVKHPRSVYVTEVKNGNSGATLLISVASIDKGAVIGRAGHTIRAIRQIFSQIGRRDGRNLIVKIDGEKKVDRR